MRVIVSHDSFVIFNTEMISYYPYMSLTLTALDILIESAETRLKEPCVLMWVGCSEIDTFVDLNCLVVLDKSMGLMEKSWIAMISNLSGNKHILFRVIETFKVTETDEKE